MLTDDELHRLQAVLTNMLSEIVEVCEKHGIECYVAYGSCLGAVRHQGFIPWDDDLDICMFRNDYERFAKVFEEELGARYVLNTPEGTKGYGLGFPRIRLKGTTLKCRDDFYSDDECGVYIDLLIWDDVPNNVVLRALHGFVSMGIGFAYSCRRFRWYGDYYLDLAKGNEDLLRIFKTKVRLGALFSFMDLDGWTKLWYRWNGLCRSGKSQYVSIPSARKHYFGELHKRSDIRPPIVAEFGGVNVLVPLNYAAYLTSLYGPRYMELPPESEREKHIVLKIDLGDEGLDG